MSESTYHSEGVLIDYTPGTAKAAGDIEFHGDIAGQVVTDLAANEKGALRIEGVVSLTKASGTVFAAGAVVHWDNTNELAVASETDGIVGRAVGGGADGQTYVLVKLNATPAAVVPE